MALPECWLQSSSPPWARLPRSFVHVCWLVLIPFCTSVPSPPPEAVGIQVICICDLQHSKQFNAAVCRHWQMYFILGCIQCSPKRSLELPVSLWNLDISEKSLRNPHVPQLQYITSPSDTILPHYKKRQTTPQAHTDAKNHKDKHDFRDEAYWG